MGILQDIKVIVDGKVSDAAFKGYINDVKKMLKTGDGIFPSGVECNKKVEPTPGAELLRLEDEELFPEFHSIWRPRYESMVFALDVPGDFQLAKNGLLPMIDPTAVATAIGVDPPDLTLEQALGAMIAGPPMGTQPFIALYFPKVAANLSELTKFLNPNSDFLKILVPSPPIPAIPKLPNPLLFQLGYTERFNFEVELALAPVKTQAKLMLPALSLPNFPELVSKLLQGDVVGGLIKFVCDQVASDQPKSMSTSSLEIAAQQVLQQHQVKYQSLCFVGQNVGSGVITKGLATAPPSSPFGVLNVIPPEEEVEITYQPKLNSAIRTAAIEIISNILGPAPGGKCFYGDGTNKFEQIAPNYSPIGEATWNYYESLSAEDKKAASKEQPALTLGRNYTTCGEFPRYVYDEIYKRFSKKSKIYDGSALNDVDSNLKIKAMVTGAGLGSMITIGKTIEKLNNLPPHTVWVNVDPHVGAAEADILKDPSPGDIILFGKPTPIGQSPGKLPGREILHVAVVYDVSPDYWTTAEAGQGSKLEQGASYTKRKIARDNRGIISSGGSGRLDRPAELRQVLGWLNVDLIPELQV